MSDESTTLVRVRPSQFEYGDRFQSEPTVMVLGLTFVVGGVRVDVQDDDGAISSRRLNGRYKYDMLRKI